MLERLDRAHEVALAASGLSKGGQGERAREMLEFKFDPALVDTATAMNRLINILGGETREATETAAEEKVTTYNFVLAVLFGGTVATALVAFLLVQRSIGRPLQQMAAVMHRITQNEFSAKISGLKRRDEVGTMARAVFVFRDNAIALSTAHIQRQRAREQAAAEKRGALDHLAASFENKILNVAGALAGAATQLDESARSMSATADESGAHARAAAVVAEETTTVACTVSSAIDELSAAMHEIDSQLASAASIVSEAMLRANAAVNNTEDLNTD